MSNVVLTIPCLQTGGTERQTLNLARAAMAAGHHPTLVCYFDADPATALEFQQADVPVLHMGLSRRLSAAGLARPLFILFRDMKPDIVHVQYMTPGLVPILAARAAGIPRLMATVHQPGTPYGWKAHALLRTGATLCTRFVCVSEAVERSWFGDSRLLDPASPACQRRRHLTIPNSVDIERIDGILARTDGSRLRSRLGIGNAPVIGAVSRLSREKGLDLLLAAFARVVKAAPSTHLILVGDGDERAALTSQAAALGLTDAIIWAGALPWERAMEHLSIMDVVAVPSRFEGFGLTALEAMACGRPVASFRVQGLAETVEDGVSGVLAAPADTEALATAITRLLTSGDLRARMGAAGRRRAESKFSPAALAARVAWLYDGGHSADTGCRHTPPHSL